MASRSIHIALTTLLVSVAASRLHAQTRNWDGKADACNAGAFQACMSVQISLAQLPPFDGAPAMTSVTMRIQNLAGPSGPTDAWENFTWVTLGNVSFEQSVSDDAGVASSIALEGTAGSVGDISQHYGGGRWLGWGTAGSDGGQLQRQAQFDDGGYAIAGCQTLDPYYMPSGYPNGTGGPWYAGELGYVSTCGGGWVIISFVTHAFEFTDATYLSTSNELPSSGLCTSGADCPVVPEPATLVLLGTGLLGIGGVRLRRKRGPHDT